jgi:hypothetical protein
MKAEQLSLFHSSDDEKAAALLAGVLPQVRAAMHRVAGTQQILSREMIADRMTEVSRFAGVRVSPGNAKGITPAMLEKWLNPVEREHPPTLLAVLTFCMVTKDPAPLRPLLAAMGLELMTSEDKALRDYGRACVEERKARKKKKQLEAGI